MFRAGQRQYLANARGQFLARLSLDASQQRQILDVLLAACVGLQSDRSDRLLLAGRPAGIEQRQRICTLPGGIRADRLPGEHAIDAVEPGIDRPGRRLHVALIDVVRPAIRDDDLPELLFTLEHQPAVFEKGAAGYDVIIEDMIERVALPFGARNVTAKDQLRVAPRLPDSRMERLAEISQRPVILKVGRLVEQPRR